MTGKVVHRETNSQRSGAEFPFIKIVSKSNAESVLASSLFYSKDYAFLHIAKTGGTSLIDALRQEYANLSRIPTLLFHSWNLSLVRSYFPNIKLCFLIRDPLERIVSGFQSRLSMGLPRYHVPWTAEEATSFSIYPSVEAFIEGHLSNDPFHISAIEFTSKANVAIRWGYTHHFETAENVRQHTEMFELIKNTRDGLQFANELQERGVVEFKQPKVRIQDIYKKKHESAKRTQLLLGGLTTSQLEMCRKPYLNEYRIYNALEEVAGTQIGCSSGDI